jgi:hypothetical protein
MQQNRDFPDCFKHKVVDNLTECFDLHITNLENMSSSCHFMKNIPQKIYSNFEEASDLLLLSSKISSNLNLILLCPALRLLKTMEGELQKLLNLSITVYDYSEEVNFQINHKAGIFFFVSGSEIEYFLLIILCCSMVFFGIIKKGSVRL